MAVNLQGEAILSKSTTVRSHSGAVSAVVAAPFALRCGAFLIDYVLIVGILAFTTIIARTMGGGAKTAGTNTELTGYILMAAVLLGNLVLLAGLTGQTVGKWATGLKIERDESSRLGIGHAALRHLIGYPFSFATLGLGFILAAFSTRGKSLHDIIAGTVVVREVSGRKHQFR
jgi:uncharacterized RDD family membrane protein YckC